MYSSSGRHRAFYKKVDLTEQNECEIKTQNNKNSLNNDEDHTAFP